METIQRKHEALEPGATSERRARSSGGASARAPRRRRAAARRPRRQSTAFEELRRLERDRAGAARHTLRRAVSPETCATRGDRELSRAAAPDRAAVDLYWLPLGAGGHFVKQCGRAYEALMAWLERRAAFDLYHSALQIELPEGRYVVEQTPVPDLSSGQRGVVAEGAVGSRWAGGLRVLRYEVRLWRDGRIPDVAEAVDSPRRLSDDVECARGVLEVVHRVPALVWGRDELRTGDMWNSNSIIAWVLASSGLHPESIRPPTGGRAPGWRAGIAVAASATGVPGP